MLLYHDEGWDNVSYSLEAVNHQPANKYLELEAEMQILMNKPLVKTKDLSRLAELTYKYFGLQVDLKVIDAVNAYAQLLILNDHNPLFSMPHIDDIKDYAEEGHDLLAGVGRSGIITLKNPNEGKVDLVNAKVSGVFSTYVLESGLGINSFRDAGFTHLEVLAIYLHELGHVFTSFSYSSQYHRFNQVLELSRQQKLKSFEEVKTYFINESKKQGIVTQQDVERLNEAKTHVSLSYEIANALISSSMTQLPSQILSNNTGEQLADMFASRLGYGAHLASGLNKMLSASNDTFFGNTISLALGIIFNGVLIGIHMMLLLFPLAVQGGVLAVFSTFFYGFAIGAVVAFIVNFLFAGLHNKDNSYDTAKRRLIRIKHQLIDYLKVNQKNMGRVEYQTHYDKITTLDKLIKYKGDNLLNAFDYIVGQFKRDHKQAVQGMKFEQAMEDLLYSDLHISSANLRTLIKG